MKSHANEPTAMIGPSDRPVKPGTPLYHALKMIADQIANDLENQQHAKQFIADGQIGQTRTSAKINRHPRNNQPKIVLNHPDQSQPQ